ncbi:MAG TPA: anaerobic ribonucleoside-triphosphate reductase activating protein [Desulfotignum sp.]|jgi:pyruvate formate lyase activating enzyme|nr:anaerobic ribonucleoside-triphosphate reductase activating protein [Desulfotignum sp.]
MSAMHIGGFQKTSLIDFPGTVACVIFTVGCNFLCPFCHNPGLAAGPVTGAGSHDITDIFSFLASRKGLVDGVVITGGEPCLQPDLADVISRIKQMGFTVKLDTNGSRPDVLAHLLELSLVDYVAMDIKTGASRYPELMKPGLRPDTLLKSADLVMEKAPDYEFRTTCVRPFIDAGILAQIGRQITGARRYVLQNCVRHVPMLDPDFSRDPDRFFSGPEIDALKAAIEGQVQEVVIR